MRAKLRVAAVGYTNAWPLTRFLDRERFEVIECVPSEAAKKMRLGEADLGLVPVAALLTDGDWKVAPGLAIGCDGEVASVLLVGEKPLSEWDTVALDGESRTSVVLAQILLNGPLGRPDMKIVPVDAGSGAFHAQGNTGAVVIGDAAMNLPDRLKVRIDLGKVWKDWTGLPFVFAVWASRVPLEPEDVAALRAAAERGMVERQHAPVRERAYLTENIRYTLDDRAMMGLRRFAALGFAAGLLPREEFSLIVPPARLPRWDVEELLMRASTGQRLSFAEGVALAERAPLDRLGAAANLRRQGLHPNGEVGYSMVGNLDYSHACLAGCSFCSFRSPEAPLDGAAIDARLATLVKAGASGVLLQGGLDPALGLEWHLGLIGHIRATTGLAVFGYGPDEVLDLANRSGISADGVLDRLAAAGLDGLPGAGAEVLVDRVRRLVAPRKATVFQWLSVLEAAHRRGLGGHAGLLVGVGESREEQVEHLIALRELQDRTGGLTGIAVWPWVPVPGVAGSDASATAWLRALALSRLLLDNVNHVQAGWQGIGLDLAQAGLWMGADELGPALLDSSAIVVRGTEVETVAELERHLKVAGFQAVRRDFWRVNPEKESHAQL